MPLVQKNSYVKGAGAWWREEWRVTVNGFGVSFGVIKVFQNYVGGYTTL